MSKNTIIILLATLLIVVTGVAAFSTINQPIKNKVAFNSQSSQIVESAMNKTSTVQSNVITNKTTFGSNKSTINNEQVVQNKVGYFKIKTTPNLTLENITPPDDVVADCNAVKGQSFKNKDQLLISLTDVNSYNGVGENQSNSSPAMLANLKKFIDGGEYSDYEATIPINAFHRGCGGYAAKIMKNLGTENNWSIAKSTKVRAVLAATGQGGIVGPIVYAFVQDGDRFAMIQDNLQSQLIQDCINKNDNVQVMEKCSQDLMQNNKEVEFYANQKVNELLTNYELE